MWLWPLDREALLRHVSAGLRLRGGVRPADGRLWQLGTGVVEDGPVECFYRRPGPLTGEEGRRIGAYRRVLVFHGPSMVPEQGRGVWVPLVELFHPDGPPAVPELATLLRARGDVRFGVIPLPHPSGRSTWLVNPENQALLDRALGLLAESVGWRETFGEG